MRVSELVALPLSASRRDISMIVVRGKGNKERLVPLNEASRQAMADYLAALEAQNTHLKAAHRHIVRADLNIRRILCHLKLLGATDTGIDKTVDQDQNRPRERGKYLIHNSPNQF